MAAITATHEGDALVVHFLDRKILEREQVDQVSAELNEALEKVLHGKMRLDFSGVYFLSTAMITKLVQLNRTCKSANVDLQFCNLAPNILEVLYIAKLDRLFDIEEK